jgi:hypothetical protein
MEFLKSIRENGMNTLRIPKIRQHPVAIVALKFSKPLALS